MWKLTEALDLTEEQAGKFFPLFRNFQNSIDSVRQSNDELFKKLDGYITAGEKTKIEEIITQIEKNEAKILDSRTKFRKDAAKVLDEIQIGKLVMFHHEFPRRFRDAIWDYRMHEPLPPGPPVPPEPRGK
jgi:Spy/CpxP family protein refolding chaperone